jgi:hypothetical protein
LEGVRGRRNKIEGGGGREEELRRCGEKEKKGGSADTMRERKKEK